MIDGSGPDPAAPLGNAAAAMSAPPPRRWWEHPLVVAALILAVSIPLLFPPLPPLVDFPGHLSTFHVELSLAASPLLQRYYEFHWQLMGNLGLELLIIPFAKLFGLELGAKLIVILIPMLIAAGFLAVARALHGRIPATALFALPLAYFWPFEFGFLNFSLSTGLCLLLFALWLHLGRTGRVRLRALLFVPLASLLWVVHTYGWGLLGVFVFAAETAVRRARGQGWIGAAAGAALACVPLMLPFVLMILWRSGAVSGDTGDWEWKLKLTWLACILRERWMAWDVACAGLLWVIALMAVLKVDLRLAPAAAIALPLLALLFLIIPRVLIGSGFADMRLAPVIAGLAVVGATTQGGRLERFDPLIAAAALLFVAARLGVTTAVFADISSVWQRQLGALSHIDPGSRVLVLDYVPCGWSDGDRANHLSSLAVVRRDVYTNGQWTVTGAQMLAVKYDRGAPFVTDPSHLVHPPGCGGISKIRAAVDIFPRAFDYLWLVDVPQRYWPSDASLQPIWQDEAGILYRSRVPAPGGVSRTPTGG